MNPLFAVLAASLSLMPMSDDAQRNRCCATGRVRSDDRILATPMPYADDRVDDVRRPGFNGRLWVGETFRRERTWWPTGENWEEPLKYGAGPDWNSGQTVRARVGVLSVGVNAWSRINDEGLRNLERARQLWLKEQGYTRGTRTFVNPKRLIEIERAGAANPVKTSAVVAPLTPRATIRLESGERSRPVHRQVDAGEAMRFSWPHAAPADAVARTSDVAEEPVTAKAEEKAPGSEG